MSNFKEFKTTMQAQFESMISAQDNLFITDIPKDTIWDTYLDSYPEGTNEIYKERRQFDCNSCRQFIRPYGNLVAIKHNKLVSIWDIEGLEYPYNVVAEKLSNLVKSAPIKNTMGYYCWCGDLFEWGLVCRRYERSVGRIEGEDIMFLEYNTIEELMGR